MRAAVAMVDHPSPDWIGAALGAGATAFVGVLGWLGIRSQLKAPRADPQAVQNDGWEGLLDQMRLELKASARQRDHLNRVLEEERRAWRVEREAWRVEREAFLSEIHQLQAVAEGFERLLVRNGITLPPRKVFASAEVSAAPSVHESLKVVDVTLRQDGVGDDG